MERRQANAERGREVGESVEDVLVAGETEGEGGGEEDIDLMIEGIM